MQKILTVLTLLLLSTPLCFAQSSSSSDNLAVPSAWDEDFLDEISCDPSVLIRLKSLPGEIVRMCGERYVHKLIEKNPNIPSERLVWCVRALSRDFVGANLWNTFFEGGIRAVRKAVDSGKVRVAGNLKQPSQDNEEIIKVAKYLKSILDYFMPLKEYRSKLEDLRVKEFFLQRERIIHGNAFFEKKFFKLHFFLQGLVLDLMRSVGEKEAVIEPWSARLITKNGSDRSSGYDVTRDKYFYQTRKDFIEMMSAKKWNAGYDIIGDCFFYQTTDHLIDEAVIIDLKDFERCLAFDIYFDNKMFYPVDPEVSKLASIISHEVVGKGDHYELISRIRQFPWVHSLFPGTVQYQMSRAEYQDTDFSMIHVDKGRGIHIMVKNKAIGTKVKNPTKIAIKTLERYKIEIEKVYPVEIIAQYMEPGAWVYTFPGYDSYVINIDGLRYNELIFSDVPKDKRSSTRDNLGLDPLMDEIRKKSPAGHPYICIKGKGGKPRLYYNINYYREIKKEGFSPVNLPPIKWLKYPPPFETEENRRWMKPENVLYGSYGFSDFLSNDVIELKEKSGSRDESVPEYLAVRPADSQSLVVNSLETAWAPVIKVKKMFGKTLKDWIYEFGRFKKRKLDPDHQNIESKEFVLTHDNVIIERLVLRKGDYILRDITGAAEAYGIIAGNRGIKMLDRTEKEVCEIQKGEGCVLYMTGDEYILKAEEDKTVIYKYYNPAPIETLIINNLNIAGNLKSYLQGTEVKKEFQVWLPISLAGDALLKEKKVLAKIFGRKIRIRTYSGELTGDHNEMDPETDVILVYDRDLNRAKQDEEYRGKINTFLENSRLIPIEGGFSEGNDKQFFLRELLILGFVLGNIDIDFIKRQNAREGQVDIDEKLLLFRNFLDQLRFLTISSRDIDIEKLRFLFGTPSGIKERLKALTENLLIVLSAEPLTKQELRYYRAKRKYIWTSV